MRKEEESEEEEEKVIQVCLCKWSRTYKKQRNLESRKVEEGVPSSFYI